MFKKKKKHKITTRNKNQNKQSSRNAYKYHKIVLGCASMSAFYGLGQVY
jgi:hypothetical protein